MQHDCFSGYLGGRILTAAGWKDISEVCPGDQVLTLGADNKTLSYSAVLNRSSAVELCQGCLFESRDIHLETPIDQRAYSMHLTANGLETALVGARDINTKYYIPMTGFEWQGREQEYFILPEASKKLNKYRTDVIPAKKIDMKSWLEFFGFWLADGCTTTNHRVSIAQNVANKEYVLQLIRNIGYNCSIYIGKTGCAQFIIQDIQLWAYLQQFGKGSEKYIPQEYLMLDKPYLEKLLHGYLMGDSHKEKASITISSTSYRLIENLEELLLKCKGQIVKFHKKKTKRPTEKDWYRGQIRERSLHHKSGFPKATEMMISGVFYSVTLDSNNPMLYKANDKIIWVANNAL